MELFGVIGHIYFYIFSKETNNVVTYTDKIRNLQIAVQQNFIIPEFEDKIWVIHKNTRRRKLSVKIAKVWILAFFINTTICGIL